MWSLAPPVLLLLLLLPPPPPASAMSIRGTTAVPECTSASYCPAICSGMPGNSSSYVAMAGSEHALMGNTTGERQLHASVVRMVAAVEKRFGPVQNDVAARLHLSFQYLCCYNRTELARIETIMAAVRWKPVRVRFTRVVCASYMALGLADPAAQGALFGVVSAVEDAMAAAGLGVRVRFRAEQAPFHASLFSAEPGHTHNISDVIKLAQSTIAASGGLNTEPIVVDSFEFNGKTFHAAGADDGDLPCHCCDRPFTWLHVWLPDCCFLSLTPVALCLANFASL
jgi:hypothetical protein